MDIGSRPLSQVGAPSRLLPFVALVALALTTLAIEPRPRGGAAAVAVVMLVVGVAAGALLPWRRWPSWIEAVPAIAFVVPVALLRDSTGGSASGLAFLALLPVLWLALYGSWRQMLVSVCAVALAFVGPVFLIGAPHYASVEWRRAALAVMVASLLGVTVHRLVNRLAAREHDAADAARRLQAVLAAVTEHSVIGTDRNGTVEVFNAGAERMLGWRAEEVVGHSWAMVHDPTELAVRAARMGVPPLHALLAEIEHAGSRRSSWTYVRKDATSLPVELTVTAVLDRAGRRTGFIGVAEDVTARRAADQRLRDSESNLAAVARVVRSVQSGQDARDAIVTGVMEAAASGGVFLFEPDGAGNLVLVRSRGSSLTTAVLSLAETSATVETFLSGKRLFICDPHGHPLVSQRLLDQVDVATVLFEPVVRRDEVVAVLVVAWGFAVASLADRQAAVVALLADEAAVVLEHSDLVRRLQEMAATDPLTGLANRRAWDQRLELEMARSVREGKPLTVALLDLDHFKAFNDAYGHQAGDELLTGFAGAAGTVLRGVDLLARWGGEEFVLALPGCGLDAAPDILGRVRARCRASRHARSATRSGTAPRASRRCWPAPTPRCTRPSRPAATGWSRPGHGIGPLRPPGSPR